MKFNASPSIWPTRESGPLTITQQHLWYQHKNSIAPHTLNLSYAVFLQGKLDYEALSLSLNALIEIHEPLRTIYLRENNDIVAKVKPPEKINKSLINFKKISKDNLWSDVEKLAKIDATTPFDIGNDDALRVSILILDENTNILLLSMHHLTSDAWGMRKFCKDWSIFYKKFFDKNVGESNQEISINHLSTQCIDAALAERRWLASDQVDFQIKFWATQSHKIKQTLVEFDYKRLPIPYLRTSRITFEFSNIVEEAVLNLQNEYSSSAFEVLSIAFSLVLRQLIGLNSVLFGSLIANRNLIESQNCLGAFYNAVAYIYLIEDHWTIAELFNSVSSQALAVYENQNLPFSTISSIFSKSWGRDASKRLKQIMFYLDRYPVEDLQFENTTSHGLHFDPLINSTENGLVINDNKSSLFSGQNKNINVVRLLTASGSDLSFFIRQGSKTKTLSVFYKTDLIANSTAVWIKDSFFETLIQLSENSDQEVSDIVFCNIPSI